MDAEQHSVQLIPKGKESIAMVLFGTFVAVCGSFEYGSSVGYTSPTEDSIIDDLGLTTSEYSVFGSILTIGAMFGAIMSGRIADFVGRKGAMATSCIFCIAGWLIIFFAESAWSLDLGRLSSGFGVGLYSYVVPVYIAEITPQNLRGGLTTANQLMIACGSSVIYVLGILVSWRVLALIGIVPCVIQLIGLFFVPESPRWLAKFGKEKKFEQALQSLRGKNTNICQEAEDIKVYTHSLDSLPKSSVKDLFRKKYARSIIIGVGLMIFQQFGGANAILFYASTIFKSAGFTSTSVGTVAMAIIQVPMTFLGALLLDRSGRKPLLILSAGGSCLGCFIAAMSFIFQAQEWFTSLVPAINLTGILMFVASYSLGMGAIPWIIMSEIFPINVKGTAGSLVTLVNWFGSWAVTYTFNILDSWSLAGTFFIYSAVSALAILFVMKLVPETKGKTLEEIQEVMN